MGLFDGIASVINSALTYNPITYLPYTAAKTVYGYATQPSAATVSQSADLTAQAASWDQAYSEGRTVAPLVAPTASTPGASYYTVKSGDTLSKIAAAYGTTYQNLMSWNGLKGTTIYPGDRLLIRSAAAESSFLTQQAAALDTAYAQGKTVLNVTPTAGAYGPVGAPATATATGATASLEKYLPYIVVGLVAYKLLGKKGGKK